MTNAEKYKNIITNSYKDKNNSDFCSDFIEPRILSPLGIACKNTSCHHCNTLMSIWLQEEYKKQVIDWNKVPLNTPIWVSDNEVKWYRRNFAKFENNLFYVWDNGGTQWTAYGCMEIWNHAELVENIIVGEDGMKDD